MPAAAAETDLSAATEVVLPKPPMPLLADAAPQADDDTAVGPPAGGMQPFFQQKDCGHLGPGAGPLCTIVAGASAHKIGRGCREAHSKGNEWALRRSASFFMGSPMKKDAKRRRTHSTSIFRVSGIAHAGLVHTHVRPDEECLMDLGFRPYLTLMLHAYLVWPLGCDTVSLLLPPIFVLASRMASMWFF